MRTCGFIRVRVLSAQDVRELLPYPDCIELIARAMKDVSRGKAQLPLRSLLRLPERGALGIMPGSLADASCFGVKLLSLFPGNHVTGRSSHLGLFVLYDMQGGEPLAILEAGALTAVRTAAASAVATRALARSDSRVLGIVGAGEEAVSHVEAFHALRRFDETWVWGRNRERVEALIRNLGQAGYAGIRRAESVEEVCGRADVICTVTSAAEPVLQGRWLRPGAHLCLVGSSLPDKREVDDECVSRSRFFVDFRASALNQAGELLHAIRAGVVGEKHICAEIGAVLDNEHPGRLSDSDITVYKSLGVAAQDLAAASYVYRIASEIGRGAIVSLA